MKSAAHISAAQLKANRENAARSTGPRTEAGKNRARLNGLRHGLAGDTVLMPYENRTEYEAFVAETIQNLQPESDAECSLAAAIADTHWRLKRLRAVEENILVSPEDSPRAVDARQLALLSLYEQRIQGALRTNAAELARLQSERKAARERALEEAMHLFQLNESKGAACTDTPTGFGYSNAEIARRLDRKRRLERAKALFETGSAPTSRGPHGLHLV